MVSVSLGNPDYRSVPKEKTVRKEGVAGRVFNNKVTQRRLSHLKDYNAQCMRCNGIRPQ